MSKEDKSRVLPFEGPAGKLSAKFLRERPQEAEKLLNGLPFSGQLQLALERRGAARLQLMLLSRKSRALVRALPEAEFYFTLKEAGEDSLPLLALASPGQLTYVFDLEFWEDDLLMPEKFGRWLELLRQAAPSQFRAWLERADPELLIALLSKLVSVWVVEPDNLGAEPWREQENLFTLDEQYYFRAKDENLRPMAERVLVGLRELEAEKFYTLLDELRLTPSAETEAAAYRVRSGRLADHGFYEFDEAFAIYHFLPARKLLELERNPERPEPEKAPAGRYPILLAREVPSLLARTLKELAPSELEDFYHQLTRLCNKLMVADAMDLTELENMKRAVEKVYGYLEIGLAAWSAGSLSKALEILRRQWLDQVFSAGFSEALKLRFRGQGVADTPWFKSLGRPYYLFGETHGNRLRALLEPRPKFFSGGKTLGLREFRSPEDLAAAEQSLEQAEFCGKLFFEALGLELQKLNELIAASKQDLTFEILLATWLVNAAIKAKPDFKSLALKDLIAFAQKATRLEPGRRRMEPRAQAELLKRLQVAAEAKKLDPDRLRHFFETTVAGLESELRGILEPEKIDPRFISSILLK